MRIFGLCFSLSMLLGGYAAGSDEIRNVLTGDEESSFEDEPLSRSNTLSKDSLCQLFEGTYHSATNKCFVVFIVAQRNMTESWSFCRYISIGGRKGLLIQPRTIDELDVIGKLLENIYGRYDLKPNPDSWIGAFTGIVGEFTSTNQTFYYAHGDSQGIVEPFVDEQLDNNSTLWDDGEPDKLVKAKRRCVALYKPELDSKARLDNVYCHWTQPVVCEFTM